MFEIVDLHNHALYGLDDGADSYDTMCSMIDISYADGVRTICFTPHYLNIGNSDPSPDYVRKALESARDYCTLKKYEMRLFCGSEVSYHFDCVDALTDGRVLTVNNSRYVLVDFLSVPDARAIKVGVERLLNSGYIPIVAHVERYPCLYDRIEDIRTMSMMGAVMQLNSSSLFYSFFSKRRKQAMKLLREELVDVVASDAHGAEFRTPHLKNAAETLISKFGHSYAKLLLCDNPEKIISDMRL